MERRNGLHSMTEGVVVVNILNSLLTSLQVPLVSSLKVTAHQEVVLQYRPKIRGKVHRQPAWSVCHCSQVLYAFFGCCLECMLNGHPIGVMNR
jgi:hypothetical protein